MAKNEYSAEIWKRIRERIEIRYGTRRTILISIIALIIVNGVTYVVLYKWWGADTANQQIVAFMIATLGLEVLLSGSFLYFWRFYDIPYEIFTEQKNRISESEPVDPFEFIIRPGHRPNPEVILVGIDIANNSAYQINCYVSIQTRIKPKPEILGALDIVHMAHFTPLVIPRKSTIAFHFANAGIGWPNAVLNTQSEDTRRVYPGKHDLKINC